MKAIFVNGSPRKNWNTHMLLQEAMRGAVDAGAEAEIIHLADYPVTGCKSCFACKLKNSTCGGICAIRDELRPVYEKIMDADVLVLGSPVYFGNLTAISLAFIERLVFPVHQYKKPVNGVHQRTLPKQKKVGLIVDMNCPEEIIESIGYTKQFSGVANILGGQLSDGNCPVLYSCDTLQFSDYARYDVDVFDPEKKKYQREQQFPMDLAKAYELGKQLCS